MKQILSNMAGTVWQVLVARGDSVKANQDVIILESMKMEINVASKHDGIVKELKVSEGDFVNDGDVLIELE
ncbi:acetyl-CoA carboxylase biotin carboxyl carrier protein subunit [Ferviditalea candida]|uniref:Acetyl-CoA carboxylase biotin carboxyl carrier protein subunit n=1 Tax=Ferviditalea candida TaxID=3108399 RepID=A0ABU5ZHU4_9BACL|nr:acetyl-CoA carboxylase biotin carboxyl carrier protein subunit [Paenibacillaceae bacterium T2]